MPPAASWAGRSISCQKIPSIPLPPHQGPAHARPGWRAVLWARSIGLGGDDHAGRGPQQETVSSDRRALGRTARQELQPVAFHCDIPNTVMVNAVGKALRDNMVKGKKFITLTADYISATTCCAPQRPSSTPMAAP